MPRRREPQTTLQLAFVALHSDVCEHLEIWSLDRNYRVFATQFVAMLEAFRVGREDTKILHDGLFRTRLKSNAGPKVDEYGGRQKGGAPRVFCFRWQASYIFLAAGVEKQEDGCRTMVTARQRAVQVDLLLKAVSSESLFYGALNKWCSEIYPISITAK